MNRRFLAVVVLLALAALLIIVAGAAARERSHGARAIRATPSHHAVSVDPTLRRQLTRHPRGVPAIVVTWNRAGLRLVRRVGVRGAALRTMPMILTKRLTRAEYRRLTRSAAVRSISANGRQELMMEDSTWITKARYAWNTVTPPGGPPGLGVTGAGVDVAVIDTGVDGRHEDMDNLVEFCETQQAVTSDHTTVLCSPFNPASGNAGPAGPNNNARLDSTDDPGGEGHGSHTSGTVAGSGEASGGQGANHSTIGMAPRANLHVYSANIGPSLLSTEILAAYDDMIFKKTHGLSRVVAVSNSWGGGGGSNYDPNGAIQIAIKRAYDAGILSVFAAGNDGPEHNTLSSECVSPFVVCVAASTKPDSVVMFSSRGRPSEPADTNRDGIVGGADDIAPDNQDRAIGQAYNIGLYRPALTAPGVNIYSVNNEADDSPGVCADGTPPQTKQDCYVAFNGTSMATPHVTGAVALVAQAYRMTHGNVTPTPGIITDILERSANVSKLPGYESEEQGAGRLNVYAAVTFAKSYPNGLPKPNFGTPSPPYAANKYPGAAGSQYTEKGCTSSASWSVRNGETPLDPIAQPPGAAIIAPRYGQHFIDVPAKTERLRVTVNWSRHTGANLYVRLWRPGVDPDAEVDPAGPSRVFPDQEAIGLEDTNAILNSERWLDIRAPEEGRWTLRVYHRAGGASSLCDADSKESPKQTEGFNYTLNVEMPQVTTVPTVAITSPSNGFVVTSRFVNITGTAGYPTPWDGVTDWEVPGSGNPLTGPEPPDTRTVLHFHGNADDGCTGDGAADEVACDGPLLTTNPTLSPSLAASWFVPDPLLDEDVDRSIVDPNWVWKLNGASTTVSGPMTVEWWASCGACSASLGFSADWVVSLWADGSKVFEQRLTATPSTPNVPEKLIATVNVPTATASQSFVLKIDPVYIDSQANTRIYYDSTLTCPAASGTAACDSIVRMPVGAAGSGGPGIPQNVRVTDVHSGLRVAWDGVSGATAYQIFRSTDPTFAPTTATRIMTTAGTACNSPNVPSWPTASRSGRCYTDSGVSTLQTYYYRVVAVQGTARSNASLLAYGTPAQYDRQVKLKVDRVYGPQSWEYADLASLAGTSWSYLWDTLELAPVNRLIFARSFTQGIGSTKATLQGTGGSGGTPATLTLTPHTATNEVGQQHCVTATVKDSSAHTLSGVTVRFSVTGPGATSGSKTTGSNGQATFCYTSSLPGNDSIVAYADTNGNNMQDMGEPSDTATKTWTLPSSTPVCEATITSGGWIIAMNGDRANFGGNARSDSAGNTSGQEEYQDRGPASPMNVHSIAVLAMTCNSDRTQASIFGTATKDGSGSYNFRIDVTDRGEPGSSDTYRMRLSGGTTYDSGEQTLRGGNVQIH